MSAPPDDRRGDPLLVVALGGNAMQAPEGDDSVDADFESTRRTARKLVEIAQEGWRLVVTHGNGPQVGNHLLRSELGETHGLPGLPLEVCVADTQGGMGYMLQQCLTNAFAEAEIPAVVASVVTQVAVDPEDPAFASPSKPVGEMITEERVEQLREAGWLLEEEPHRHGWRRVVASPRPKEIVEAEAIRALVDAGVVVIAAGGGGVPVVPDGRSLKGTAAVVDKDLASALLAIDLRADVLLILTDVEQVAVGFDSPVQRNIETMTVDEARSYLETGEFPAGTMGPKVEALVSFVSETRGRALITSVDRGLAALQGRAGTRVTTA